MSYYYDDMYGDYGAPVDLYGGVKRAPRKKGCIPPPERKSDKPMTDEQRARHSRSLYLHRRCEKRQRFLKSVSGELRKAEKREDVKSVKSVARIKRAAARDGSEQSKLRAFVKKTNGFGAVEFHRTRSGYVVSRELKEKKHITDKDEFADLKNKRGFLLVDYKPHTTAGFVAWRTAVEAVQDEREQEGKLPVHLHPDKKGKPKKDGKPGDPKALLAKKNGDEHEKLYYADIMKKYELLEKDPGVARMVAEYNVGADAHNAALKDRSDANKAVIEKFREAERGKREQEKADRKAARDKRALEKAHREVAREERPKAPKAHKAKRAVGQPEQRKRPVPVTAVPVTKEARAVLESRRRSERVQKNKADAERQKDAVARFRK
jgi:hypothetical protein